MNDFWKKNSFPNVLVVIVLSLVFIWGAVNTIRLEHNRHLVSEYQLELEQSRESARELEEKQRAIEELTRNAIEYCDGNEQYIEQSVSTVRELQAQIKLLEDCYNRVKLCLFGIRDYNSSTSEQY